MTAATEAAGSEHRRPVLVVGSWAKEQITIEHLQRVAGAEVHACLEIENPAIIALADGHRVLEATDIDGIVDYATAVEPDVVMVTTAEPLEHGLADALEEAGIPCFAPRRQAARLEWDKAFARRVVAACCPEVNPAYRAFADAGEAKSWAAAHDWQVAVKPLGLTGGLGVRVAGDQLADDGAVADYIDAVCATGSGDGDRVVLEERLIGEEFTLQALVCGSQVVTTPLVQDFKKLLAGDEGPNTASMGSYSQADGSLPFLQHRPDVVPRSAEVLRDTLATLESDHGVRGIGVLYGQFMLTAAGLKLVEFNFRPGDPEWLNTVATLETSLLDAVDDLIAGRAAELAFRPQASVVKYLVPRDYPRKLDQMLDLRLDQNRLDELSVRAYMSAGLDAEGRLNVGEERGVALLACADEVDEAHRRIEAAIESAVRGDFRHRTDIGSPEMLRNKQRTLDQPS